MNFLYQSAFAEALGWSLIDSLWQMGAIWLLYIITTGNGNRFSSKKRHSLALLGSAAGTLLFIVSLAANLYSAINHDHFLSLAYFIEKQSSDVMAGFALADNVVPFLSFLYVPAVVFFLLRLALQVSINKNIYRTNLVSADSNICQLVKEMSMRAGILKNVTVWISEKVESPLTIGFWKPVIFLPFAVFGQLSCTQVEAVIMHELHHIKRNDYVINIFLTVAGVFLFFNPFARMIFSTVKKERENSCDDYVIASGFDSWEYSQALYLLGRYRNERNNLAIAATGEGKEYLLQRIRRIMNRNNPSPSVLKPFLAFFLCLFVAGFAGRHKQIVTVPEVASKNDVKQVVYYFEEKRITQVDPKTTRRKDARIKIKSRPAAKKITEHKIDVTVEPELEVSDETFQSLVTEYVAAPQVIEFTFIDQLKPVVPDVVCESPQPFVQKSSFYFTEVDTTLNKKVIEL